MNKMRQSIQTKIQNTLDLQLQVILKQASETFQEYIHAMFKSSMKEFYNENSINIKHPKNNNTKDSTKPPIEKLMKHNTHENRGLREYNANINQPEMVITDKNGNKLSILQNDPDETFTVTESMMINKDQNESISSKNKYAFGTISPSPSSTAIS